MLPLRKTTRTSFGRFNPLKIGLPLVCLLVVMAGELISTAQADENFDTAVNRCVALGYRAATEEYRQCVREQLKLLHGDSSPVDSVSSDADVAATQKNSSVPKESPTRSSSATQSDQPAREIPGSKGSPSVGVNSPTSRRTAPAGRPSAPDSEDDTQGATILDEAMVATDSNGATKEKKPVSAKIRRIPSSIDYYPLTAKQANHQGNSVVRVCVDAYANVESVTIVTSSGHPELDEAAIALSRDGKYVAGKDSSGEAVPSCVAFRVKFEIKHPDSSAGEAPARIIRLGNWGKDYRSSIKQSITGGAYAVLRVCINADNSLRGEPELVTSSFNANFDSAALRAARLGRYEAGSISGEPRPGCVTFSLTGERTGFILLNRPVGGFKFAPFERGRPSSQNLETIKIDKALISASEQVRAVEKIIPEWRSSLPFIEDGIRWLSVRSDGLQIIWEKEFQTIPNTGFTEGGIEELFRKNAVKEVAFYCSSRRFRNALRAGVSVVTRYRASNKTLFGIVVTDEGCRKK